MIGLQYIISVEWVDFSLKCLVTVTPNGLSPTVKDSVCNIPISEIDSNCNSLLRLVDGNRVMIMKLERKLKYS